MTCGACVSTVESALSQEPGVVSIQVSLATEEAQLEYNPAVIGVRAIASKIEDLGFESAPVNSFNSVAQVNLLAKVREINFWKRTCVQSCCFMVLMLLLYKACLLYTSRCV